MTKAINIKPAGGGGGGAASWGSITGTLANQTDLNTQLTAIKAKTDKAVFINPAADFSNWSSWRYTDLNKTAAAELMAAPANSVIYVVHKRQYTECVYEVLSPYYCFLIHTFLKDLNIRVGLDENEGYYIQNIIAYPLETSSNRRTTWQATPEDTKYPSEKLVKDSLDQKADIVHIYTPTTAADYEIGYDEVTNLGTLTGTITLTLEAIAQGDTEAHLYHIIFTADTTVPTITWPEGITWAGGSAPTITASKTYEISIFNNLAIGKEY